MSDSWWSVAAAVGPAWRLLLVFTAVTALVLLLRHPARRLCGARRAFDLWLLPPLAMLASQLPHPALAADIQLPSAVFVLSSAASAWTGPAAAAHPGRAIPVLALLWLAGVSLQLLLLAVAQHRYRAGLCGAVVVEAGSPWRVLRADRPDIGPALVGCWRPSIVLPGDFERRYDRAEQALILAHEHTHAQRRDGWWCLLGRCVTALFWFHPLAWWAFAAMRRDQELACDAAVLERYAGRRHAYARAMLKTQPAAMVLPVGCSWSVRHPLTERIAMLKQVQPSRRRRTVGALAGTGLIALVTGVVYAANTAPAARTAAVAGNEYQLDLSTTLSRGNDKDHAEYARVALCMKPGQQAAVQTHGWEFDARTMPAGEGQVHIDLSARQAGSEQPVAHLRLLATLDTATQGEAAGSDGEHRFQVDVTPHAGCPARAGHSSVMISEKVRRVPARTVAEQLAAKAGWALVDPQALGDAPVTLDFQDMPVDRALWLVADMAGMTPVFDGSRVRFERK